LAQGRSSFSCHRVQLIVCLARSRLIAKVVGSLAPCRAIVLRVPGFVARAEAAGLALGDKAPVGLTSRGDKDHARLVSSALASLYEYRGREGCAFSGEPGAAKAAE
jgi:hypothetical protein